MRDLLINNCLKYIGVPYVWGGESRAEGGFDCSGLVYNVLNDTGLEVGRTTAQGYYNKFKGNPCGTQTRGALLFFGKSEGSITHVLSQTDTVRCSNQSAARETLKLIQARA